jgi:hypothetical protein
MIILSALRKRVPIYSKIERYVIPKNLADTPSNELYLTMDPADAAKRMLIKICQCKGSFFI